MKKVLLSLAALTALAYAPSLGNDFQSHDDTLLITHNHTAQGISLHNIAEAFSTFDPELYIPVTLLTYQIESSVFGQIPFIFHLTSLLLHIGSAIFVFLIALKLSKDHIPIAATTAFLFALHPLNTEAVAWAAARKDVLSSFFLLASIWAYLRSDPEKKWYIWSVVFFALGLMSKVSIVMLPVLLLLIDDYRNRRAGSIKRVAPYAVLSMIFGAVALLGKQHQISELSILQNILLWCKSAGFYLWKLFVPEGLSIIYNQDTVPSLMSAEFALPLVLVFMMVALACMAYKRVKVVSLGIAWYLICLLPSFATFWKNGFIFTASDRYAYLAMIGIVFALATLLIPRIKHLQIIGSVVACLLVVLTMKQSLTWKDTISLYERSIALNPRPVLQLNNLGTYYSDQGSTETARDYYDQALELDQRIPQTLANIGKLLRKEGQRKEAAMWFERSIKMIPQERQLLEEDIVGYFFLGEFHEQNGDIDKGIEMFETAALRAPQYPIPHVNLGIIYQKYHRLEEAKVTFLAALEVDETLINARYRLAAVQAETGDFADAIENLEYVVKQDSDYQEAARHLEQLRKMVR